MHFCGMDILMFSWHIELELQSWVYNTVMGAPHAGIHQYV